MLRVVAPVFDGTTLLGYVELGKEIEDVVNTIHRTTHDLELTVVLNKNVLKREMWEEGMQREMKRAPDWECLPHNVISYTTNQQLTDNVASHFINKGADRIAQWTKEDFQRDGKIWRLTTLPLVDANGTVVGDLLVMNNITQPIANFHRTLRTEGAIGGFTLIVLMSLIYFVFSRADRQIRKQHQELKNSKNILQNILESALSGYWDWNLVNNTEYLSPTFKKMFGYEDHEMENSPEAWQKIIFPQDLKKVLEVFDRHVESRGRVPFYNEIRYHHKDGSVVWVICAGNVIEWTADGKPVRMVGCHVDINERKRAEEALRQTKTILKTAMDCSPAGIAIADAPDGQLRYVNNAGLFIRGSDRQSVVNGVGMEQYVSTWKLLDLDGRPLRTDEVPLARAIMFGETNSRDFIIHQEENKDRIVTANAAPIKDETGKVTAAIVVFSDITEKIAVQNALIKAKE